MPVDLSLVLACYNEEGHLDKNVRRIIDLLDCTRFEYELIFVDDCSRDGTRAIIDH
jgi:polyisoprenyl-phosphate glycosyltransferase